MIQDHNGRTAAHLDTASAVASGKRKGFALPMAILVIAFMTVTVAVAYSATSAERLTNDAQRTESKAYMIAQAGMESFMARRNEVGFCPPPNCGLPPAVQYESTTVRLKTGVAYVVAQRLRAGDLTKPAIYLLRSRGVDTTSYSIMGGSNLSTSGRRQFAERTVAQLVYWNVNQVNVLSGWTATNGLNKQGSSGTISGVDANTGLNAGCPPHHADVAGIAIPSGDYSVNGNFTPQGNPPVQYLGTQQQTNDAVKIDWNGIINGNRIQPDYFFASGSAAAAGWPSAAMTGNNYPVIRVNGDFTLPAAGGQGTLIVMGNLTVSGDNLWHGILLVGGQMTSNGNGTVTGATMSGLNTIFTAAQRDSAQAIAAAGTTITTNPPNATANGTKTYQYDSCEVSKAAGGLASYSVYPNAWMDNFVTY